ncbi:MAG: serine/threonine-protein kinase [Polyangiaceae bacterium]
MPNTPSAANVMGVSSSGEKIPKRSEPAPSCRYLPGALLSGKYRLEELLGEGGMGSVWRASNLLLDLPVAIKLIRADLDQAALRARLQLEARSAAKLAHPAIVRVFDVGESELGDPFIVMEMLQGETLAHMLSRGRLSGAHAVQLLLPIVDALGTAHSRGIVHRDLKPDNVMITLEDQHIQPKILDFGIAKLTDPTLADHKLTVAGAVLGSPEYMSPEQARGLEDVDATTDIWSICVVLYEAVTGTPPFSATNYNALLRMIVEDQPRSIVERAAGDDALWAIIARGLGKDRRNRYQSMLELGQAMAAWLVGHGIREDAAGASIESKWLGRSSDASALAPRSNAGTDAAALPFKVTQESHPGATGFGRGPFTASVLPRSNGSKRVIGALALSLAVALGAFGWHALKQSGRDRVSASSLTLNSNLRSALAASEATPSAVVEVPAPPPPPAAAGAAASSVSPVVTSATSSADPRGSEPVVRRAATTAGKHPAPTTRQSDASPAAPSKPALVTTTHSARPQSNDRPLDLLAPY